MFGWAIQIMYSASHDGVDSFAGLGALLPLGIFCLLGLIDLILIIVYVVKLSSKKLSLDMLVFILAFINIVLVISYNSLADWALSGPG